MLFGNQGEAQADKPVGGRGTAAGWVLTEESGQAVPQSGPPRDGATNPLMALCILYINHSACEHTRGFPLGIPSQETYFLSTSYFTSMQSTSWELLGWMKHKLESRVPGEISMTSDMQMTPSYGRKGRGAKEPLDESERGE